MDGRRAAPATRPARTGGPACGCPTGAGGSPVTISAGSAAAHWRAPGRFGNIGLRYRLTAGGPWSPVSADRKEIDIVAVSPDDAAPRRAGRRLVGPGALRAARRRPQRRLRARRRRGGGGGGAVDRRAPAPAEADWRDAVALADGRWHLGQAVAGNLDGIAIRWRLAAAGPWSAASRGPQAAVLPRPADRAACCSPRRRWPASGRIGEAVAALPGLWTGAPALGFQWCRDGAAIPGRPRRATGRAPADDRTALTCRITATTAAGSRAATTAGARR